MALSVKTSFQPGANEVCWVYKRPEGDIEVWAETREEAARTIRAFGFLTVQVDRLIQVPSEKDSNNERA